MKLSIITINYNNAEGLRKTLASVAAQSYCDIEHIIIDGGSTDDSVETIREYVKEVESRELRTKSVIWTSEKDNGIYHAMNKGIRKATGEYIQILNSGDILAAPDVTERMIWALEAHNDEMSRTNVLNEPLSLNDRVPILYGNMIKQWPDGRRLVDKCEAGHLSMLSFYHGTLNHDSAYIRRDLFERFGLYDEDLKIVSDWKWYLQVIPLGGVTPVYVDIDVTIFDMTGVSESNTAFWKVERRPVLEALVQPMILADYDKYGEDMLMMDRLRKHHLHGLVRFVERVLFKLEKWGVLKK